MLGGARSGKSRYAEALAPRLGRGGPVIYLATAEARDDEMRARIARHQADRPATWMTLEAPIDPVSMLVSNPQADAGVVLLDCVTLWVANLLLASLPEMHENVAASQVEGASEQVYAAVDTLLTLYRQSAWSLILVSNEVGLGLVPPYPLGRVYRDVLGKVNARLASEADAVILLVAGLPLELKTLAAASESAIVRCLGLDEGTEPRV